jgi:hypothetical protein
MAYSRSEEIIDSVIKSKGNENQILEYMIELERERFALIQKNYNGGMDFDSLRIRMRSMEEDIVFFKNQVSEDSRVSFTMDSISRTSSLEHMRLQSLTPVDILEPSDVQVVEVEPATQLPSFVLQGLPVEGEAPTEEEKLNVKNKSASSMNPAIAPRPSSLQQLSASSPPPPQHSHKILAHVHPVTHRHSGSHTHSINNLLPAVAEAEHQPLNTSDQSAGAGTGDGDEEMLHDRRSSVLSIGSDGGGEGGGEGGGAGAVTVTGSGMEAPKHNSTHSHHSRHSHHHHQHHQQHHHRHLSIGSQPLFTLPNAFQYGIKLRDTKMNGMSMYDEDSSSTAGAGAGAGAGSSSLDPAGPSSGSPLPGTTGAGAGAGAGVGGMQSPQSAQRVQGSRERESNIRTITERFTQSLEGTTEFTNRNSFSIGAAPNVSQSSEGHRSSGSFNLSMQRTAHSPPPLPPNTSSSSSGWRQSASDPRRSVSAEAGAAGGGLSTGGAALARMFGTLRASPIQASRPDAEADMTMESIDGLKRHSIAELTGAVGDGLRLDESYLGRSSDSGGDNEEDTDRTGDGLGVARQVRGSRSGAGVGAGDESFQGSSNASVVSTSPEGTIEFCIVEADWTQLHLQSERGHLLTPLLPPRRSWRYPPDLVDNSSENNTKELQDQSFFFPSGVKVDLVWPSVAALRSRASKHIRHIVPFTDAQGKPTYACVLTVTQTYEISEIASFGELIVPNLVKINRQKLSAMCIQKCFRQFIAYRKMMSWQLHRVTPAALAAAGTKTSTSSVSAQGESPAPRSSTGVGLFARSTTMLGGSLGPDAHGANGTAGAPAPSKRTWSNFFSSTKSQAAGLADSMDSSIHGLRQSSAANTMGSPAATAAASSFLGGAADSSKKTTLFGRTSGKMSRFVLLCTTV